ncbi:MAG: hypothetical protein RR356_02345 [Bacteroidales bacterium]
MKDKLIEICIVQQEQTARTAQTLMNEAQAMANEYGPNKDRYDSFRSKQMRMADIYSKQLDNAQNIVRTLMQIDPQRICHCVEFGAVVVTNKQKLFISVSLGKIMVENDLYYAISVNVPIYAVMQGKKVGDEFTFNGIRQRIMEII